MPWETFAQIPYDFRMRLQIPAALSCVETPPQTLQQPHLRPGDWPPLHLKHFQAVVAASKAVMKTDAWAKT